MQNKFLRFLTQVIFIGSFAQVEASESEIFAMDSRTSSLFSESSINIIANLNGLIKYFREINNFCEQIQDMQIQDMQIQDMQIQDIKKSIENIKLLERGIRHLRPRFAELLEILYSIKDKKFGQEHKGILTPIISKAQNLLVVFDMKLKDLPSSDVSVELKSLSLSDKPLLFEREEKEKRSCC